jgi:acyl-CoA thioester hydrolase
MVVRPEWIDFNGHLNMAYYNVLMDLGVDALWHEIGFGGDYLTRTGHTTYSAEYHMHYIREVHEGDRLRATFQVLDMNDKSIHFCQELIHEDGWVSAGGEGMCLHIDQSGPRVASMPADILETFKTMRAAHAKLPIPSFVGRPMGIRHKS